MRHTALLGAARPGNFWPVIALLYTAAHDRALHGKDYFIDLAPQGIVRPVAFLRSNSWHRPAMQLNATISFFNLPRLRSASLVVAMQRISTQGRSAPHETAQCPTRYCYATQGLNA